MQKQGMCYNYNGVFSPDEEPKLCEQGVDYREMVGGPDHGWVKRTPCFKKHETDIVCELYREPTSEEIKKADEDSEKAIQKMLLSVPLMSKLKEENPNGGTGIEECPICKGQLHWGVASLNKHIHLNCLTEGCIHIIE